MKFLHAGHNILSKLDQLFVLIGRKNHPDFDESHRIFDHPIHTTAGTSSRNFCNDEEVRSHVLVVDDNANNRKLLSDQLLSFGFSVSLADCGQTAMQFLAERPIDIILLDIVMPGISGFDVLKLLKIDENLKHIPVLILSALDEADSVVRCIEQGAEDFLQKPSNKNILKTKINACLDRKKSRELQDARIQEIEKIQKQSEKLLSNTLPESIALRLRQGETSITDHYSDATVLFADLVNFTPMSRKIPADLLVQYLEEIFLAFDSLVERYGLEKIKTIGDAYMLAGGVPVARPDHATAVASIALEMQDELAHVNQRNGTEFKLRIGIHSGSLIGGVIGKNKFSFDIWGETVNIASRMESSGLPDRIQISKQTLEYLNNAFEVIPRGVTPVKGANPMNTFWINRKQRQQETIETIKTDSGIE